MNVILIVVDTLRADHLGCYGYHRNTSPNIDAFASQGALFERHIATAIPTHPAFTTINTGQYSITHSIVAHGAPGEVPRKSPWLPRLMQGAGYTTCAVDNLADWKNGFGRGYEFYIDPTQRKTLHINMDNREINRRAIPWLEQHAREKFYMFIHYWDPHTPYLPPRAYRNLFYKGDPCDPDNHSLDAMMAHPLGQAWRETWFNKLGGNITDAAYIEALYDSEIRYCDEGIGHLLRTLEKLGIADDTLVVLTGDHGELMFRHGIFFDHHGLYDGNLRVPFIVRGPGVKPGRIPQMTAHVDVAPTILELAGAAIPGAMEGTSLAPITKGGNGAAPRDFVISQECTWQMKWCVRTDHYKFILAREDDFYHTPMRELYDLVADPNELRNIAKEEPDTVRTLEVHLESWIADMMAKNGLTKDPLVAHGITLGEAWKKLL